MKILPCNILPNGSDLKSEILPRQDDHSALIFTRYFLINSGSSELPDIDAWFISRNKIFEKYTLPSIKNQIYKPKCWYIFIEAGYEKYLPLSLSEKYEFLEIKIISIESKSKNYIQLIKELIENERIENPHKLITCTRLDNDDYISDYFLKIIDRIVSVRVLPNESVISLPLGMQFDESTHNERLYVFTNNHFLTSVHFGNSEVVSHAYGFNHGNLFKQKNEIELVCTSLPAWCEVIHGDNLRNKINNEMPIINLDGGKLNFGQAVSENSFEHYLSLKLKMRELLRKTKAMKPESFIDVYAKILQNLNVESIFEIGIHQGGSIKFWREFFGTKVKIYALDINPECLEIEDIGASDIKIGSQVDSQLLDSIKKEWGPFDLIIDDGSHLNSHMVETMNSLFPSLSSGGMYVVEDMFTSYWYKWGGGLNKHDSFVETNKRRIDLIYKNYMGEKYEKHHNIKGDKLSHDSISPLIKSIAFYSCGIAVFERI